MWQNIIGEVRRVLLVGIHNVVMMVVMVAGLLRVAVPLAVHPAVVPRLVVRLVLMWFPVVWAELHHWLGRFLKQWGGVVQIVVVIVRALVVPIVRVVLKPELLLAGSGWSSLPT